ncbi:hypothetical protein MUP32_05400 [Candidatus Microgenomates bacterium]|nr:hypothetical protein [Candidatus Microgenomates bacterium]
MQTIPFEEIIKVQPKGLLTIPKKLRDAVGLEERGLVRVRKDKGRLILEPVRTLSYPVRSYSDKEINEFLALDREDSKILKKKNLL